MLKRVFLISIGVFSSVGADVVEPGVPQNVSRNFISGELWSNPMEDWRVEQGKVLNTHSGGDRNVVSLTSEVSSTGSFQVSAVIDPLSPQLKGDGFIGFQLGLQGNFDDWRETAIYGAGLPVGVTFDGRLFVGDPTPKGTVRDIPDGGFILRVSGGEENPMGNCNVRVEMLELDGKTQVGPSFSRSVHASWVRGMVAITASTKMGQKLDVARQRPPVSYGGAAFGRGKSERVELKPIPQGRGGDARISFTDWKIAGDGVTHHPDRTFGPLWWATYTLRNDGKLRLLVQLAPVLSDPPAENAATVTLEIAAQTHQAPIEFDSSTALFEIDVEDISKAHDYTVIYEKSRMKGVVQAVPDGSAPLVVASLSCNDSTGFPHNPLFANVAAHEPDVITFHGDQIYESIGGYGYITDQKPNRRAEIAYLRKYAMHGWTWAPLLNTRPSITIPDDHDVMHGNIWGEGGKLADMSAGDLFAQQDSGGYKMSAKFVNMVHRTQTANLPLTPEQPECLNNISTYHCRYLYGPMDFLVLADRQFKSAPKALLPEADIHNGWPQNLEWDAKTQAHVDGAEMLGAMQEEFLAKWAEEKVSASPHRVVISQSPWLATHTLPKGMHHDKHVPSLEIYDEGGYAPEDEPKADFDNNGWPKAPRDKAVALLKKAGALHIAGDQHLGTTGRYGVDGYGDGTWWIASPAIANVWPRRWMPSAKAQDAEEGWPRWKGGFEDGFGNQFTMIAVANPRQTELEPARVYDRSSGYTITRYTANSIILENWPYQNGPQRDGEAAKPFEGWPVAIGL